MPGLSDQHTAEVTNLAALNDRARYSFDISLLAHETKGAFWEILQQLRISLAVSREYEHFVLLIGAPEGIPYQSPLPLPHPSGISYDDQSGELIVSSTRTPNQIFWFKALEPSDSLREIGPADPPQIDGVLFLPARSTFLPGSLYIHEIAKVGVDLLATVTGHNFIGRIGAAGGWERVWWPRILDKLGPDAFRQNLFQLNGMTAGQSVKQGYFTAFSQATEGTKPWKNGYGPRGKGVVFSGQTRDVACQGLTCPHSPRLLEGVLWLCNSGYGELSQIENHAAHDPGSARIVPYARLPGFTRGLAFVGEYGFIGLSRVIESYEPYAPGVPPERSVCGIAIVNMKTGEIAGSLTWPAGYQVFDIQVLPGISKALFPFAPERRGEPNVLLRDLG